MMGPLYLFLSLATLSQVPVSGARFDDGAVNFGSGMPLPGFRNIGPQYGGQQPAYGGQQPAYGGQQPAYGGQQVPTYESSPEYASQHGYSSLGYGGKGYGQPSFLNSGYGPGFMSAPVFGGFGHFGGPHASSGGYFGGPYEGFGRRIGGKHGHFKGFGTKYVGGFGGYGGRNGIFGAVGRFDPYGDFEMIEDQNADDYPFGADLEEDGHLTSARLEKYLQKQWPLVKELQKLTYTSARLEKYLQKQWQLVKEFEKLTSTSARLEKYLQKQWQLGKRKLQVQEDFENFPLEWEYFNQYHGVRHPLSMTAFGPKYGLAGPPAPRFDYGFGPTGPIGGPGGQGYGYGGPGYGPGYPGSWILDIKDLDGPGYGPSQGSGRQQQHYSDQDQQTSPAPAQQSSKTQ